MKIRKLAYLVLKPHHYRFACEWAKRAYKAAKSEGLDGKLCKQIAFSVTILESCYQFKIKVNKRIEKIVKELAHTNNDSSVLHSITLLDTTNKYVLFMYKIKLELKQKYC